MSDRTQEKIMSQESQEKDREQLFMNYRPTKYHPDYHLIKLLKKRQKDRGLHPKDEMLELTRTFWLPLACLDVETYTPETIEQLFWESITKLNAQQELLWKVVGKALNLERPQEINSGHLSLEHNHQPKELVENERSENPKINSGLDYDEAGIL